MGIVRRPKFLPAAETSRPFKPMTTPKPKNHVLITEPKLPIYSRKQQIQITALDYRFASTNATETLLERVNVDESAF